MTTKKIGVLLTVGLIFLGSFNPISVFAEESKAYPSHGTTSFYGTYEKPDSSVDKGEDHGASNGTVGGASGGSLHYQTSPNYSASGKEIIPRTGDQNLIAVQSAGMILLLSIASFLWIQKRNKKGEKQA